jgi:arylsulfatase A-like enzyme
MRRRDFLKSLGLAAIAGRAAFAQAPRKPNIVFIIVDDMGYGDLGCYGSKVLDTPRIDRMAAEGMRFTDAYSGCTVCAPARSALMTGKHLGHAVVRGNTGGIPMPAAEVTVAEVLKTQGYTTGGFGKWGLGDLDTEGVPEKNGFDLFYGYYHQIHAHYYYPEYLIRNGKKEFLSGNAGGKQQDYSHYLIFEEAKRFIRENRDKPFFCYCPWTPPHGRYEIPEDEPAWRKYKDKEEWERNARVAAAMDEMLDRHVGELLDLLKELGIDDNTIVFFCSDNGASERFEGMLDSSGPLRGRKRDMYEGGIRVPMIVRWPGQIKGGEVSDLPWYFPDVLPTLAELAGAETPPGIDGISVVPALLGQGTQQKHECLYWEWPSYDWRKKAYTPDGLMQAVRSGKWKMLRHKRSEPWQLYDLENDLAEQHDIAQEHPGVVEHLVDWLAANRVEMVPQVEPEKPGGKRYR